MYHRKWYIVTWFRISFTEVLKAKMTVIRVVAVVELFIDKLI